MLNEIQPSLNYEKVDINPDTDPSRIDSTSRISVNALKKLLKRLHKPRPYMNAEEAYDPIHVSEVVQKAKSFEAHIDYGALSDYLCLGSSEPEGVGNNKVARVLLNQYKILVNLTGRDELATSSGETDTQTNKWSFEHLTYDEVEWREKGLLISNDKTDSSVKNNLNQNYESIDHIGEINNTYEWMIQTSSLIHRYGLEHASREAYEDLYRLIDFALDVIKLKEICAEKQHGDTETDDGKQQLLSNLANKIAKIRHQLELSGLTLECDSPEYRQLVVSANDIDVFEAIDAIDTSAMAEDGLCFDYNKKNALSYLANLPPLAYRSLRSIQFGAIESAEEGFTTAGHHEYEYLEDSRMSSITINNEYFNRRFKTVSDIYGESDSTQEIARVEVTHSLYRTLLHESAHALHASLPIATMKRWEEAIVDDETAVTQYVQHCSDTKDHHKHTEDFAETLMLFVVEPDYLYRASPARFEAMQTIYKEFMPLYEVIIAPYQKAVMG